MISKKLLSEVLDKEVLHITEHFDGEFDPCLLVGYREYEPIDECDGGSLLLNIYELAHKCKEWANITKGFYLSSGYDGMDNKWEAVMTQYTFPANTEPEAIFKACQWVLDNKE